MTNKKCQLDDELKGFFEKLNDRFGDWAPCVKDAFETQLTMIAILLILSIPSIFLWIVPLPFLDKELLEFFKFIDELKWMVEMIGWAIFTVCAPFICLSSVLDSKTYKK